MTFREQRKGQMFSMHCYALAVSCLGVGIIKGDDWWLILFLLAGWELLLIAIRTHRCWDADVNLDDLVPLDKDGKPTQ